jgi:hypothetical protein
MCMQVVIISLTQNIIHFRQRVKEQIEKDKRDRLAKVHRL